MPFVKGRESKKNQSTTSRKNIASKHEEHATANQSENESFERARVSRESLERVSRESRDRRESRERRESGDSATNERGTPSPREFLTGEGSSCASARFQASSSREFTIFKREFKSASSQSAGE